MAVVESNVNALELEKVAKKVRVLFERDDKFYTSIKKATDAEVVSSRLMRIPLELRPGGAFQYFDPNGGDLGRGGGPTWDKAVVNCVFVSENIEYTKLTQWSTNSDRKAILNAVKRMTASALDELRRQIDSQLMQSGNGVVGTIDTVTTVNGVDSYQLSVEFGARLVRFGQTVQVFSADLATNRGKGQVTTYDADNSTIELEPGVAGVIAGDVLVVDGINSPASTPAIYGVPYHHSNSSVGTWLGFSRATNPEIRSNRVNGNNSPLALPLARLAMNKIGNRIGIDNNVRTQAWLHPAQLQAYEDIGQAALVINQSSTNTKDGNLNMYFGGKMQLAGSLAVPSYSWNKSRIDFINKDAWGRVEILPIGFYKTDGRHIFEIRSSTGGIATSDIFYMVWGGQFYVNNPAATAYIDNLAVPEGYQ